MEKRYVRKDATDSSLIWIVTDFDETPALVDGMELLDLHDAPYGAINELGDEEGYKLAYETAAAAGYTIKEHLTCPHVIDGELYVLPVSELIK